MAIEIWKDIVGYEGLYQVSNTGRVRGLERTCLTKGGKLRIVPAHELKYKLDRYGYPCLHVSKNKVRWYVTVHRLVALTFLENPENHPQVNHKDGNKTNNHINNLEWCSPSHNAQHSFDTGLHIPGVGTERPNHKLTPELLQEMIELRKTEGLSYKKLEKKYGINSSTIYNAFRGKTWKHVNLKDL